MGRATTTADPDPAKLEDDELEDGFGRLGQAELIILATRERERKERPVRSNRVIVDSVNNMLTKS